MEVHVNSVWTDTQSEVLIRMLAAGNSYAQIAVALNQQFNTNYSRNAVCGKGFRLRVKAPPKMKAPPKPRKRDRERIQTVKPAPRVEEIRLRCAEIEPRHLTLEQLEPRDCRYPFGDGPFTFCGRLNDEVSSYCPEHAWLTRMRARSTTEALTEIRARWMRRLNYRKTLLEVRA